MTHATSPVVTSRQQATRFRCFAWLALVLAVASGVGGVVLTHSVAAVIPTAVLLLTAFLLLWMAGTSRTMADIEDEVRALDRQQRHIRAT